MFYRQTVLLTGVTFLGLTAYALRLEQLYFMAAVLVCLAAGSYVVCLLSLRGLEISRGPARRIHAGDSCDLTLVVTNRSHLPKVFLSVEDGLPQWLEPIASARFVISILGPKRGVELTYRVSAAKRGAFTLGPVTIAASDPLGVFRIERRVAAPQEMIVYPALVRVAPQPRAGVRSLGGVETEQVSAASAGLEFYGIRDYRPGDALRRIHWPSTARLGHFAVVEFEESFGGDLVVTLDLRRGTEAGTGKHSSLETAITAAASLAAHALENGVGVVIAAQDAAHRYEVSARRREELPALLEALARMEASGAVPLAQVMEEATEHVAGTTALFLTAAPDEALLRAAESWVRRQAQVVGVIFDAASYGVSEAPDMHAFAQRLQAAGARVEIFRHGDEIEVALGRAMSNGS